MTSEYLNYENIKNVLKNDRSDVDSFTLDDYKYVLESLNDEKSKMIFYYRIMFDNTKDIYYCLKMFQVMYFKQPINGIRDLNTKKLVDFLLEDQNYKKNIYIIGYDRILVKHILLTIYGNDDNYIKKIKYLNCWIEFKNMNISNDDSIFIIGNNFNYYVKEKLIKKGINKKLIFTNHVNSIYTKLCVKSAYSWSIGLQYFGEPFLKKQPDEIFIDCGAYLLDTTCEFIDWCNGDYKKIYALEPSYKLYKKCLKVINKFKLKNIQLYNKGIWDSEKRIGFKNRHNGSSTFKSFENDWDSFVNVINIDKVLNNEKVTLIKMDVEGSEYEGIIGAKESIIKYKPRLLISGYHLPNDCIKLTKKILEYNPDYKVYIRHYNFNMCETVLYFV